MAKHALGIASWLAMIVIGATSSPMIHVVCGKLHLDLLHGGGFPTFCTHAVSAPAHEKVGRSAHDVRFPLQMAAHVQILHWPHEVRRLALPSVTSGDFVGLFVDIATFILYTRPDRSKIVPLVFG